MVLKSCLEKLLTLPSHRNAEDNSLGFLLILIQQVRFLKTTTKNVAQLHNSNYHHVYLIDSLQIFNITHIDFGCSGT